MSEWERVQHQVPDFENSQKASFLYLTSFWILLQPHTSTYLKPDNTAQKKKKLPSLLKCLVHLL